MSNHPNSDPPPPQRPSLDRDECIAILVAFATIGYILFWATGRKTDLFSFGDLELMSEEPTPVLVRKPSGSGRSPSPDGTVSPSPGLGLLRLPNVALSPSPERRELPPPKIIVRPSPSAIILPPPDAVTPNITLEESPSPDVVISPSPTPEESPSPDVVISPSPTLEESPSPDVVISPSPTPEESPSETTPSTPLQQTPAAPLEFSDVSEDDWARPFIRTLAQQGIVGGYPSGQFKPNEPVTRAQLAAQLEKLFADQEDERQAINFEDITSEDYWASEEIQGAYKKGFLSGYPGDVFKPDQQVPRVQVLVALVSGLNLKQEQSPLAEEALENYEDKEQIPDWAIPKVAAAVQGGLIDNVPNKESLRPNQPATRREVAAMMYQALVKAGKIENPSP